MESPGWGTILSHTAFEPHWLLLLAAASAGYAYLYRRGHRVPVRSPHSRWRLTAFYAGIASTWLATVSPIEHYGNEILWVNFLGFVLLCMVAAPLFILAQPLTLAFRMASPARSRTLRSVYRSWPVAVLTNPIVAWLLFAIVTYAWQFSDLTVYAAKHAAIRDLQQFSLLLVGLAFWTPALCSDPLRWRMNYPLRALYIVVEMAHKALFGALFLALKTPFHDYFAESVPAWGPTPMEDQRAAILILIASNLIFIVAFAGIAAGWVRYEARQTRRIDRRLALEREALARRKAAIDKVFTRGV